MNMPSIHKPIVLALACMLATVLHAAKPVGNQVEESLGKITLDPDNYDIRLQAVEITGMELMNPRKIILKPLTATPTP